MRQLIQALPQGFLWYPVVLVLLIVGVRIVLLTARKLRPSRRRSPAIRTRFQEFEDRIGHPSLREGLKRSCIGMILTAEGYSGYSVANCRDFVEKGAPEEIRQAITDHLEDGGKVSATRKESAAWRRRSGRDRHAGPDSRRVRGGEETGRPLPPRVETLVSYIEQNMEA